MTDSEKLDLLLAEMLGMKSEMQEMKADLQEVKERVTRLELIVENEIRINIQRVAEGHLDLSRNLHDAMVPSSNFEMLTIKVRLLESEVRDLRAKLA